MKDFFARFRKSGRVTINGVAYDGSSVSIAGGRVIVDGVEQSQHLALQVTVQVEGSVEQLQTASGDVTVNGSAGSVETASGDVRCGPVQGSVQTVSGDVSAASIAGSVKTVSGDIRR
jgi:formylmethanofuran dehydrogenase subunit C